MTYDWLRSLKQPIKMLIDPDSDKSDLFSASIVVIQHNYFNIR